MKLPVFGPCNRCGRTWYPRKPEKPKRCGRCKSPYWNKERVMQPKTMEEKKLGEVLK